MRTYVSSRQTIRVSVADTASTSKPANFAEVCLAVMIGPYIKSDEASLLSAHTPNPLLGAHRGAAEVRVCIFECLKHVWAHAGKAVDIAVPQTCCSASNMLQCLKHVSSLRSSNKTRLLPAAHTPRVCLTGVGCGASVGFGVGCGVHRCFVVAYQGWHHGTISGGAMPYRVVLSHINLCITQPYQALHHALQIDSHCHIPYQCHGKIPYECEGN